MQIEVLDLPPLPFSTSTASSGVWQWLGDTGALVGTAPAHSDLYVNPGGADASDAESMLNAATLIGRPPHGDFEMSARVGVDFASQFDAGVLLVWVDETHWAKFCFEFSPASEPMVVSVVTREVSDDANAFVVEGRSVWLRVSRVDGVYAFHASTDARRWQLIRVFSLLSDPLSSHQIGFEVQAPTGDGCTVTFDQIQFTQRRLNDLRDGS